MTHPEPVPGFIPKDYGPPLLPGGPERNWDHYIFAKAIKDHIPSDWRVDLRHTVDTETGEESYTVTMGPPA